MTEREGVTRYQLHLSDGPPPPADACAALDLARAALVAAGVVGYDPRRYDGVAFGNVSIRLGAAFAITGTGTGDVSTTTPEHYATVTTVDVARNAVVAVGPRAPSSEAMTHAAVYAARPDTGAVVHGHDPALWRAAPALGLPETAADVAYGTPAMSRAVGALVAESGAIGVIAMRGHVDGVLAWAPDLPLATDALLQAVARARALP